MTKTPLFRPRHDGWTPERQAGFIAALTAGGTVAAAAASVGMSRRAAYRLRDHPAAGAVRAAWSPPRVDHAALVASFDRSIDDGYRAGEARIAAEEAAYRGGHDVWLRRALRDEFRRARRRVAAARRREISNKTRSSNGLV